jgi:N-methylhydantoinase B
VGSSPVSLGIQIMEAVLEALSKAVPHKSIAGAGRNRNDMVFGTDSRVGKRYLSVSFNKVGCLGAVHGHDGYQTIMMQGRGAMTRGNIEEEEVRVPWRYLKYEIATDLMGAGRWRGGYGVHWEAVNDGGPAFISTGSGDGDATRPYGALGGHPSPFSRTWIRRGAELIPVKTHRMVPSMPGDVLVKHSAGGGGVGHPAERDRQQVREDVRNGVVSPEAAREIYGLDASPT